MPFRLSYVGLVAMLLVLPLFSLPYYHPGTASAKPGPDDTSRTPVLVELFTSEGCSSCPPADALLQKLERFQPISGAELVVLSEHVDYWNDIGWKDPFSSHEYSERQSAYAAQFGNGSVYTPQMVVDGRYEFVGSDVRRASEAIKEAAMTPKAPVRISIGTSDEKAATIRIEAGPLPSTAGSHSAGVFLAIADNSDESQVSAGENAGRRLQHVAVLRELTRIGTLDESSKLRRDIKMDLSSRTRAGLRIVVIVQEPDAGKVLGAGLTRFSN
jgi:hypothetical protein